MGARLKWGDIGRGKSGRNGRKNAREDNLQACRTRHVVNFLLLALPAQALAQIATPAPPSPDVLRVTHANDGGDESLRWAIERNNAAPGRYRIEIDPAGPPPYVIKPASALPAIKGPVQIEGMAW